MMGNFVGPQFDSVYPPGLWLLTPDSFVGHVWFVFMSFCLFSASDTFQDLYELNFAGSPETLSMFLANCRFLPLSSPVC